MLFILLILLRVFRLCVSGWGCVLWGCCCLCFGLVFVGALTIVSFAVRRALLAILSLALSFGVWMRLAHCFVPYVCVLVELFGGFQHLMAV